MAAAAGSIAEEFTEAELEAAAVLCDLPAMVRARCRRRRRPEIPTWGSRRPRTVPVEKPAAVADRGEGAASPDTPLAFPEDEREEEAAAANKKAAAAAANNKARAQAEWAQEQRGVVASLFQESAHLLKQIEEFKARLHSARSTNANLKQMQSMLKWQRQRQEEEEERKRKLQAQACASVDRPAPGLDLNEPSQGVEEAKPQAALSRWRSRRQQQSMTQKPPPAVAAASRRQRQEIRRAKAASRTPRVG